MRKSTDLALNLVMSFALLTGGLIMMGLERQKALIPAEDVKKVISQYIEKMDSAKQVECFKTSTAKVLASKPTVSRSTLNEVRNSCTDYERLRVRPTSR